MVGDSNYASEDFDASNIDEEYLAEIVRTIGLENAYLWYNTVEFKPDADVIIKLIRK